MTIGQLSKIGRAGSVTGTRDRGFGLPGDLAVQPLSHQHFARFYALPFPLSGHVPVARPDS
jgi:hypothetical protein